MSRVQQVPDNWSDAERWAWGEIRAGRIADFNKRYNKELDPVKLDGWDNKQTDRRLSKAFIVTILTEESFHRVIPFKGVRVNGASFEGMIDLQHARLERQFWIEHCRLEKKLNMVNLQANGWLSLKGSWLGGGIDLSGSEVNSNMFLQQVKSVRQVNLTGTKISGQLAMNGSNFDGKLSMGGTEVGQHLFMHDANFNEVDLTGAKIGGQLAMIGSTFDRKLNMNGTEIGQGLLMREGANFKEVDLTGAKIDNLLAMDGSTFDGKLDMNGTHVSRDLLMHKSTFKKVDLTGAKIGGSIVMDDSKFENTVYMNRVEVDQSIFARSTNFPEDKKFILHFGRVGSAFNITGATICEIDLTAAIIAGELHLSSIKHQKPINWVGASRMVLRNTSVNTILDTANKTDSWPQLLELSGFVYKSLGGFDAIGAANIATRDSEWLIGWLERDKNFSPQPYEQLANVLHETGYPSKANAIRFASRNRSRRESWERREGNPREWLRWIGLTLLQYIIGYGLGTKYFRVLWWFGGFTLIGFIVLLASIDKSCWSFFKMFWASFDQVLPIVKLNEVHEKFILETRNSWTIAYFYVQKLIGYVLGGFLGAGLGGLTQKS